MTQKEIDTCQMEQDVFQHPVINIEDADISFTPPDSPTTMARQQAKNLAFLKKLQFVLDVSHIIEIDILYFWSIIRAKPIPKDVPFPNKLVIIMTHQVTIYF